MFIKLRRHWPALQFQSWPDQRQDQLPGPSCSCEIDRDASCRCTSRSSARCASTSAPDAWPADTRLPSTRALAAELRVSRGVVTEAYGQLAAEGYLTSSQGAPVRVARAVRAVEPARARALAAATSFPYHFHPGLPDLAGFPREAWLRSLRAALRDSPLASSATATRAASRSCAKRSPTTSGACAAPTPTPSTRWSAPASCRVLAALPRRCASRGVERVALEDPGWHAAPPDRRAGRPGGRAGSASTSRGCACRSSRTPTPRRCS